MLGLLVNIAESAFGDFLVELFVAGLIRPFRRPRSQAKSEFGLI
jgi:hypothetical protein